MKNAIIAILLLSNISSHASQVDTGKLILNSKMKILSSISHFGDYDYYHAYLDYIPNFVFINSSGFDERFIFYKIMVKDTVIDFIKDGVVVRAPLFPLLIGEVVFCYNNISNRIYILSGLRENDFINFYHDVSSLYNAGNRIKMNQKLFYRVHHIDGIDIKCFAKNMKVCNNKCNGLVRNIFPVIW